MKIVFSMYDDVNDCTEPKTLCEWVKNFRIKKMQMKRKLRAGGDLRVCAIMATALMRAENQLRLKQQERLNRCLQLQSRFHEKISGPTSMNTTPTSTPISTSDYTEGDHKQRIEICNLWKDELNGLDEFMRKMSSSGGSNSHQNCGSSNNTCSESAYQFGDSNEAMSVQRSIAVTS